jgi:hypothetical protein
LVADGHVLFGTPRGDHGSHGLLAEAAQVQDPVFDDERRTDEAVAGQAHVFSKSDRSDTLLRRGADCGEETWNEMRDGRLNGTSALGLLFRSH